MDFSSSRQWIESLWLLFGAYWLVSAFKRKKTKQRESWPQRFTYTLPLALGFYLLSQPGIRSWIRRAQTTHRNVSAKIVLTNCSTDATACHPERGDGSAVRSLFTLI